ncbi:MAG: hypothetical protein AAFX99_02435 [Myxococcota bacterium]
MVWAAVVVAIGLWCSTSVAQESTPLFDRPPGWFERRSGISVGLEMNRRAALKGRRPFFEFEFRARPQWAAQVAYQGRNVLVIDDDDGQIEALPIEDDPLWDLVAGVLYTYFPDAFDMILLLTSWDEWQVQGFYRPLANDVRGIGYQHVGDGSEVFNNTNSEALDGMIFMNNYQTYLRNPALGRYVFLQEIGHRWGSFVHYADEVNPSNRSMLGRDGTHWSFFMHSHNSAMEGNVWEENPDGTFTSRTDVATIGYNDLDRYLMGFMAPSDVAPWFILQNPEVNGQRDDFGRLLNASSMPDIFGNQWQISGERRTLAVEDVIAAEGVRIPDHTDAQKQWKVAAVLVVGSGDPFTEDDLAQVEEMLDGWEQAFEEQIGFAGDLVFSLEPETPIPGQAGYGDPCETSLDCDPDRAPTCLTLEDGGGRICSYRCTDGAVCGADACCAEGFCTPDSQAICEAAPGPMDCVEGGGTCPDGGFDGGGVVDGDTDHDRPGEVSEPGPSMESSGIQGGGCRVGVAGHWPTAWGLWWLGALALGTVWRRRRDR